MKNKGLFRKVCRILNIIIIMLAGSLVLCIVVLHAFNIRPYVIVSGSMEPEITTGSLCFIDCRKRSAEVGDVIAYELGGMTVTHRVVGKTSQGYITKGDKNAAEDPGIVSQEQITGSALFDIPYIGYAAAVFGSTVGIILSVSILTVLVLMRILC